MNLRSESRSSVAELGQRHPLSRSKPRTIAHANLSFFLGMAASVWLSGIAHLGASDEEISGAAVADAPQAPPVEISNGPGPLEGEFVRIQRANYESPDARQKAIRLWLATHGAAMREEIAARHEAERPVREKLEAAAMAKFEAALSEQVAAGKLGTKEAEFIRLTRTPFKSPEHRRKALEQWRAKNGAAMAAEVKVRHEAEAPAIARMREEASVERERRIGEALDNGSMGPLEAEFLRLQNDIKLEPAARQKAVGAWMLRHQAELQAERSELAKLAQPAIGELPQDEPSADP